MAHQQKTAMITGACSGLGRAIAEEFLKEGANVVIIERNPKAIEQFSKELSASHVERSLVLEGDITDEASLDKWFAEGQKKFRKIDYVVNSAGIMDNMNPVGDLEKDLWDRIMAVNLTAPAMITKRAVNMWLAETPSKGSIVNIASLSSVKGFTAGAAYTASKHGLMGLTKNTSAAYWDKGIRCNAILAGGMATSIADHLQQPGVANMQGIGIVGKTYPMDQIMNTLCDTSKMARLVLFLCSDDGDLVSGAGLVADRGVTSYQ